MNEKMTVLECLQLITQELEGISVPVALWEIGDRISKQARNLHEVIKAIEIDRAKAAENQPAVGPDEI